MVRNDAVADLVRPVRIHASRLGAREYQRTQRIGVVVVVLALQDRGEALQSEAGLEPLGVIPTRGPISLVEAAVPT